MGVALQIAEPTGWYQRLLRRFTFGHRSGTPCPVYGPWGHDASVDIGNVTEAEAVHGDNWPHDDPRWPPACLGCGYLFTDGDEWQRNDCLIYRMPDGRVFTNWGQTPKPIGAMIRIPWYDRHGNGGESWLCILPDGGQWITTQTATGGGSWQVSGTPPKITVSPSIWHDQPGGWHGHIRDGVMEPA